MYLTAYVLFGLLMVDQAGFDVDTNVLERGFNRLDKLFTSANDVSIQAYALYVKAVAERGNLTLAQQLAQNPDRFDPFGLSMLTLALHLDGDRDGAETLLAKLLTQVVETESLLACPGKPRLVSLAHDVIHGENTGAALRTLIALRPNDDLASKAVRWLLDQRQSHGYGGAGWRDTQATTFAILSLTDYIRVFQEQLADYKYSVLLNGNEIASGQVTPATVTQPIDPIEVSGDKLLVGDNEVRIEHTGGDTPLYYALLVQQELFFEGFTPVSSIDGGLAIERTYQLVEEGSVVQSASRSSAATNDANVYHVGDLVEVVLKVKAATDLAYVLISDPIPAGFEGLQENLNTVSFGEYWWDEPFMWHSWGYNYKDVRDDRVEFFITRLNAGEHTYRYRMRANLMGEYSVLPTWGTLMYEEDVYGRSASLKVTVLPEGGTALIPLPLLAGDFDSNCLVTELDARMAAAAWGTKSTTGDVSGASGTSDGIVDLYDVSAIATRRGVSCFADRSIPVATDGRARFAVIVPDQEQLIGTEFEVQVVLEEAGDLAGYGVTLNFPPHRLDVARVEWNSALGQTLPLGPYVDRAAGYMSFGGFDLPSTVKPGDVLATVVFRGNVVGDELITASSAQAAVRTGQIMAATAESRGGPVTIGGKQIFLPIKMRK
ncbi:hypothetical protein KFU94_32250 [Chloroflexi bacterium TSY]|nr:hypothetical protein [Chloroflexi bacterium TSY]